MTAVSTLVRSLLEKRGYSSDDQIQAFLEPDYALHTHSPFLFRDMEKAVGRLIRAIREGERIAVYADFDCDGIPGAALLSDFFAKIGYTNVEIYIPHRDKEGYGLHQRAIDTLAERGVTLMITVDVGTTARDAIRHAKEKGIDTIVTDHHEITGDEPQAFALINPKIAPYPYGSLCGAATAFKLVQATLIRGRESGDTRYTTVTDGWEKWLLDLVAIATIADMVPLTGENRTLAFWGLQVLRKTSRAGIIALAAHLRLRKSELTEDDIGFSIAPRINAASRMDSPELALALLTTRDALEAETLARALDKLNQSRKGVVAAIVREARKRVLERFSESDRVLVLGDTDWKPSLLGLAANSLVGDRGGVVCLWGRDAEGRLKGSCRSDGALSVVDIFTHAGGALVESGGHEMSGGFTVADGSVHALQDVFARAASELDAKEAIKEYEHDVNVGLSEVSPALWRDIARLAPFGVGNPKPILHLSRVQVSAVKQFGKEQNHIELSLTCMDTGRSARGYDFFRRADGFTSLPAQGSAARVLATLERDTYRGGVALRLIDVVST